MDDAKQRLPIELYIDGNEAGNEKRFHGIESFMGVSGANASQPIGTPSDTYANLVTTLQNYGGNFSGSWPSGNGDPQYDFWAPHVALDPDHRDPRAARQLQMLGLVLRSGGDADALALRILAQAELELTFRVLDLMLAHRAGASLASSILERVTDRHGAEKLGRELGFPTANIRLPRTAPLAGIFAVEAEGIGPAVASVGRRPTVNPLARPLLEVHLFDWDGELYGRRVKVRFREKLRDEEKYDGLEALKEAIARDARQARAYFEKHG